MKPLLNKTILVTRAKNEAEKSLDTLLHAGADIVYFPTIKTVPIIGSEEIQKAASSFSKFDYLIFTSTNAVETFTGIVAASNLDLSSKEIAVVGKSTAARCKELNIRVDMLPDEYSAKGLIEKFSETDIRGKKILIPGSTLSRDELSKGLTNLGAEVTPISIYDVAQAGAEELENETEQINLRKPDLFVFTSPSSFENFCKILNTGNAPGYFERSIICAIGTTTEQAIRAKDLIVHIVPQEFTLSEVAEAIIKYFHITANIA